MPDPSSDFDIKAHLHGYAAGRLFEIDGGNNETCVVCPFEYEPKYDTWRCVVVVGSKMYPQGGYNIVVPSVKFSDENERFPTILRSRESDGKPGLAEALEIELRQMHPEIADAMMGHLAQGPVSFEISSDKIDAEGLIALFSEMGIPVRKTEDIEED